MAKQYPKELKERRPSSSTCRVYWAMTHVMTRRLTGANAPAWRAEQAVAA